MSYRRIGLSGAERSHGRPGYGLLELLAASGSTLLDGLVSWWDLDETSGTRADAVGSYDMTDNNTCGYVSGKIGNAVSCVAGNNEFLSRDAALGSAVISSLGRAGSFSFAFWCKTDLSAFQEHIEERYTTNAGTVSFQLYSDQNVGGRFVTLCYDQSRGLSSATTSSIGTDDVWRLVVGGYDSSTGKAFISVDGAAKTLASSALGDDYYKRDDLVFTMRFGYAGYNLTEDLVGLWNRLLTDDEITELYNAGASIKNDFTDNGEGFREGLLNYWKMEEESGTRADSHGSFTLTDYNTVGYGAGKKDNAALFVSGNNEFLGDTTSAFNAADMDEGTISLWFKSNDTASHANGLFTNGYTALQTYHYNTGFWMTLSIFNGSAWVYAGNAWDYSGSVPAGTWVHAVGRWKNGGNAEVFRNAVQFGNVNALTASAKYGSNIGYIGRNGANYMNGLIDEVMFYDRWLSDDEIAALYASGAGRYYDFNTL